MESYRVEGVPSSQLQQGYLPQECLGRSQNNGAGRYGLSIRVQGIGGHPYVVLNNRDRGPPMYGGQESNGYSLDKRTDGSLIEHCLEDTDSHAKNPFVEYRSQKQLQFGGTHNSATDFKELQKKSTLLNFQRHPELLKPYDPESNALNLDEFHSVPPQPAALAQSGNLGPNSVPRGSSPSVSHSKSSSLDKPNVPEPPVRQERVLPKPKSQPEPQARSQPEPQARSQPEPQARSQSQAKPKPLARSQTQTLPVSEAQKDTNNSQTQITTVAKTPSRLDRVPSIPQDTVSSSASSSLESRRREPDVLPLRRHDSSGPVLQSPHSRRSSTSSSSTCKAFPDDQLETIWPDPINRHQNRRYIPFLPGTGRDIDTGSIPAVDELIDKFDGKDGHQRRGRAGRRNRINPEDRKRSRSVDSAFPFGARGDANYLEQFSKSQGRCTEHVLRPSQLRLQKGALHHNPGWKEDLSRSAPAAEGKVNDDRGAGWDSSSPGSPEGTLLNGTKSILGYKTVLSRSSTLPLESRAEEELKASRSVKVLTGVGATSLSTDKKTKTERNVQATPDLLKGQQELSKQTNEETAKQILFNYLKDGSTDNDDTTKKKVNLVFEKIQTLKSRAAGSVPGDNRVTLTPVAASEVKVLQDQRSELEKEVTDLKKQLVEETKKKAGLAEVHEKTEADIKELQMELRKSQEECTRLREKLSKAEEELHSTLEELFQVKMEREKYQTEIRDLQDQLSEMHDELDGAKRGSTENGEEEAIFENMMQLKLEFQELLLAKEEQEEMLRRRERELTALKGALKEEVATHDQEVDTLREQYEREVQKLLASVEEAKQSNASASQQKDAVEAARGAAEERAEQLDQEAHRLQRRAQELENEVTKLRRIVDEAMVQEGRLRGQIGRLENENSQLEESLAEVKEQEEEMSRANKALTTRLEDVQRNLTKLSQDHKEMNERLKEEKIQKEQFKRTKNEIEDERRLLDRTVEKLQKEMCVIVETSENSTQELQEQINQYKEKNRKELQELQRQLQDRTAELESSRVAAKTLREEVSLREEDLRQCKTERDEAVLRQKNLEQKVYDLEVELETLSHSKGDRSRQIKVMEDKISQLELDLDEERNSGDLLMDRIDHGREQVEQMRNELLQERATRQDLECDKIALERQNKDLKSRVAHLESSQKSNKEGLVSQLEGRIHELEERLEGEERDRAGLQLVNRRLERKVKEMMMQVDEEHHSLQDQKDQLNLRLKALKRQMDEAEEEIDRLEHGKKKLLRDLEEQLETNDQLQEQVKALRTEMRRKSTSASILNDLDDDEDDEEDNNGHTMH